MSIGYYVYENQLTEPLSYKCVPVSARVMQIDDIAGVISLKNPTLTTDIVKTALSLLSTVVSQELKKGNSVNLQNFISFVITIPSRAETIDSIDTSRMNVIGKPSSTLVSELNGIATTTRLGVNIKSPSIISASDTNTGLQNWLRQGYGLNIQGDNLDFNLDDESQGVFLTSPAGSTYRIDNISYIAKKKVLMIPTVDTNEGPAGKASVAYGLQIRARYSPNGPIKTGEFQSLRKTNIIDYENNLIFTIGNLAEGYAMIYQYTGIDINVVLRIKIMQSDMMKLSIMNINGDNEQEAEIATDGIYSISGINGASIFKIKIINYESLYNSILQSSGYMQEVAIILGSGVGKITGIVSDGVNPIANLWVDVYTVDNLYVKSDKTDANGFYEVLNLNAGIGRYKVTYYTINTDFIGKWYNNAETRDNAEHISVTANISTNLNATVLERGGRITGTVTNGSIPISNITVYAYDQNNVFSGGTKTDINGIFILKGLKTGAYKVQFYPLPTTGYAIQWYNGKTNQSDADMVNVTAPNETSGINATLVNA